MTVFEKMSYLPPPLLHLVVTNTPPLLRLVATNVYTPTLPVLPCTISITIPIRIPEYRYKIIFLKPLAYYNLLWYIY